MNLSDILFEEVYKQNEEIFHEMKDKIYQNDQSWMFCLGAGVSISAGLPSWYGLLAKLNAYLIPLEFNNYNSYNKKDSEEMKAYLKAIQDFKGTLTWNSDFVEKMEASLSGKNWKTYQGINVLETAEYIRNFIQIWLQISDDEALLETGKRKINQQMNSFVAKACQTEGVKASEIKKQTLGAVGELMKDKDVPVFSAITYNYDNLLEWYLREGCKCDPDKVHSIIKSDELRAFGQKDEWNIYHVHGRIPVISHPGEEISDSIILTETDYYNEERINYSWVNILQSYAIASENLIFIGFSGTDYNFRRIIKYVNQDKMKEHARYIIFSVDDIVKSVFTDINDVEGAVKQMSRGSEYEFERLMINHLIHAQTLYWKNHGLTVLWTSIEELPCMLDRLHP